MVGKYWWIKERHNPQFKKPHYVACGKITVKEARAAERSLYGTNYMHKYESEEEYIRKIHDLEAEGLRVQS